MKQMLVANWNMIFVRGVLAVLFGVATLLMPGITLIILIGLFGAYVLVDGAVTSYIAIKGRQEHPKWWLMLLEGLVSIASGIVAFVWPGITALALFYVIIAWAIMTGLLEIGIAVQLREEIEGEWMMILDGVLSVAFGLLLIAQPIIGALTVLWLIGIYSIAFGTMLLVLVYRLRKSEVKEDRQTFDTLHSQTS